MYEMMAGNAVSLGERGWQSMCLAGESAIIRVFDLCVLTPNAVCVSVCVVHGVPSSHDPRDVRVCESG